MDRGTIAAEAAGSRLPPLLVAADRVASTVAQGVHGRRRVGQGDSFWQFRRFVSGDPLSRIDWRQSAKSGRRAPDGWFIRETEWEAAQTVCLWRDSSPSMRWRSRIASIEKHERANLLLLALASLLLRGGERVMLMREDARPVTHRSGLDRLATTLQGTEGGVPAGMRLPRYGTVVLFSDFFWPLEEVRGLMARFAGVPVTGFLMQVLDPAETALPYQGRIRFRGTESEGDVLIPRTESVRDAYAQRLKAQQDSLADICAKAGFGFGIHHTDHAPETALLTLYSALANR
ncbi:MAG TPA: DUF58 domain-containing protein [Rhodopila sp.]|uniref:DUF58 domain-containing protein n=1 Tax=Rhodopila sp. TaxID=2480087 RepID=UPI002C392267|nr:DUF58 domain-containing protein [Rhodopila sp.]HVY16772.1 DUF58 domain-containing protein [Rhodopila sp.]